MSTPGRYVVASSPAPASARARLREMSSSGKASVIAASTGSAFRNKKPKSARVARLKEELANDDFVRAAIQLHPLKR